MLWKVRAFPLSTLTPPSTRRSIPETSKPLPTSRPKAVCVSSSPFKEPHGTRQIWSPRKPLGVGSGSLPCPG